MCGEKQWWWTVNIRGLLVMISNKGTALKKNCIYSASVIYCTEESSGSLFNLHSTGSSESKARESQSEIFRQLARWFSGVGILLYGENCLWNCKAMHQNAKWNYFYANAVCCRVNYPEHCRWLNRRLHRVSEYDEVFMIHCCVRLHCVT